MNQHYSLRQILLLVSILTLPFVSSSTDIHHFHDATSIEEKCRIADELSMEYMNSNLDSLRVIGYELLVASNKMKNEMGVNYARVLIGDYLIRTANELRGLELLRQAKNYFIAHEDYSKGVEICNEIGNGYQYINRVDEAIKWYKQSLRFGKLATDESLKYIAEINLAQAYMSIGEYELSRKVAEHYRDWVLEMGSMKDVSTAYAVLGKMALDQGNNDEAISYFEQCYEFAQRGNARAQQGHAYTNIAIATYLEGKPKESVPLFEKALELRLLVNNIGLICDAYLNLGGIHYELGNYELAEGYYQRGIQLARKNEKYQSELELLEAVKEVYQTDKPNQLPMVEEQIAETQKKMEEQAKLQDAFDQLLSSELKETERIQANGFETTESRWPFYLGGFLLFIGFYFLAIRRRLV